MCIEQSSEGEVWWSSLLGNVHESKQATKKAQEKWCQGCTLLLGGVVLGRQGEERR